MSYKQQLQTLHEAVVGRDRVSMQSLTRLARDEVFDPKARVDVYADGYVERLINAVRGDYTALAHLLGEHAFEGLISRFAAQTVSQHWDLNIYPARLPEFMRAHNYGDDGIALATLEAAIVTMFWAKPEVSLTAQRLGALGEAALGTMPLPLHNAAILLELSHDAERYLSAVRNEESPKQIEACATYVCVVRHDNEVKRLVCEEDEFTLLQLLNNGMNLNDALEQHANPEGLAQRLAHYMSRWLEYQIFSETT